MNESMPTFGRIRDRCRRGWADWKWQDSVVVRGALWSIPLSVPFLLAPVLLLLLKMNAARSST